MSLIQEPASYRGVVVEHAVGATKESQLPQFVAKFRALERYDFDEKIWVDWTSREDCEITAYLVLFDKKAKPIFHIEDIKNVFEWDGASLTGLDELDLEGVEVQFEVISDTYQDKARIKVTRIGKYDDAPGSGAVRKLDAEALAKLNTRFATALKQQSGGVKPVKAGKTTKAATTTKATTTKATPPPPPPAKTEEQASIDAAATVPDPVSEKTAKKPATSPAPGKKAPAAPPAPPKAPAAKTEAVETAPVEELTYEEAWAKCYDGKLPTVTDEQVATAFTGAMHRIAPKKTEGEITGEDWGKIADTVLGECGGG